MHRLFTPLIALCVSLSASAQELTLNLDAVRITFVADMQNTEGTVSGLKATIRFDKEDLTHATIEGTVDVQTLNTGNKKRDNHLKSADYFDVAKYPVMTFKSKKIEKTDERYVMTGMLTIKDVVREESIAFRFADNVFKGQSTIQLAHYGVGSFAKKSPDKTDVTISFLLPVQ